MIRQQIIELYPHHTTKYIAKLLGVSISKVYNTAWAANVKKSPEQLKKPESGRIIEPSVANQFKPGHIPKNKGQKMPAETYEKVKKAMFKKGHKPHNTKPDGTINLRADKTGRFYQYIKIKDSHWELLQRHIWMQANGEIPKGSVVNFIDGNYMNCDLSNLQLKTRGEMAIMNSIHRYPAEVRDLIKLNNKLKAKTNGKQQTK